MSTSHRFFHDHMKIFIFQFFSTNCASQSTPPLRQIYTRSGLLQFLLDLIGIQMEFDCESQGNCKGIPCYNSSTRVKLIVHHEKLHYCVTNSSAYVSCELHTFRLSFTWSVCAAFILVPIFSEQFEERNLRKNRETEKASYSVMYSSFPYQTPFSSSSSPLLSSPRGVHRIPSPGAEELLALI